MRDRRRVGPREVEYGGLWLDKHTELPWRVGAAGATGELYAVRLEGPAEGGEVELRWNFATRADFEVTLLG